MPLFHLSLLADLSGSVGLRALLQAERSPSVHRGGGDRGRGGEWRAALAPWGVPDQWWRRGWRGGRDWRDCTTRTANAKKGLIHTYTLTHTWAPFKRPSLRRGWRGGWWQDADTDLTPGAKLKLYEYGPVPSHDAVPHSLSKIISHRVPFKAASSPIITHSRLSLALTLHLVLAHTHTFSRT